MPDRESPRNLRKHVFGKNVCHAAHGLVGSRSQSIRSHNPRRFLPPVLQRVQAEIREFLCFWMRKDRNHAALVFELVLYHCVPCALSGFKPFNPLLPAPDPSAASPPARLRAQRSTPTLEPKPRSFRPMKFPGSPESSRRSLLPRCRVSLLLL